MSDFASQPKCIGISTIYWNNSIVYGYFLVEPYGMSKIRLWRNGIVVCWPPDRRVAPTPRREDWVWKAEKDLFHKKCCIYIFLMMSVRHPFSAFTPETTPILRDNQYDYIRFDSLNPLFQYSRTHNSNIPNAKISSLIVIWLSQRYVRWTMAQYFCGLPQYVVDTIWKKRITTKI